MDAPDRVAVTGEAAALVRRSRGARPADVPPVRRLLRRQLPHVLPRRRPQIGDADVHLGDLEWVSGGPGLDDAAQFEYWKHTHLTIDVVPGRGAGFSLEAPEGVRFLIRSRLFTDEEYARLG